MRNIGTVVVAAAFAFGVAGCSSGTDSGFVPVPQSVYQQFRVCGVRATDVVEIFCDKDSSGVYNFPTDFLVQEYYRTRPITGEFGFFNTRAFVFRVEEEECLAEEEWYMEEYRRWLAAGIPPDRIRIKFRPCITLGADGMDPERDIRDLNAPFVLLGRQLTLRIYACGPSQERQTRDDDICRLTERGDLPPRSFYDFFTLQQPRGNNGGPWSIVWEMELPWLSGASAAVSPEVFGAIPILK